jgi:hypothetical protein
MGPTVRAITSTLLTAAIVVWMLPVSASPGAMGRLEGQVLGIDGRPASGWQVHLVGGSGRATAQAEVDGAGLYSFRDVEPGDYSLGVVSPTGDAAIVAAPPVRLGAGELARRDIKMSESDPRTVNGVLAANPSLGAWWGERTLAAKIWTIIGIVAVVGVTAAAVDDEDDVSPVTP